MLLTYINVFKYFYLEKFQSVSQAIPPFHSELLILPFISRIHVSFESQLMETSKLSPTVTNLIPRIIKSNW